MKVERHISELINDHDCVIVPGMGSFISTNVPAGISTDETSSEHPHKKIVFNNFLTHNDGLLAEHIARNEKINFMDALKEITLFVHHYQEEVNSGKKFIIERVGVLYADPSRNVQFEPFENTNDPEDSIQQPSEQSLELENIDDLLFKIYDEPQNIILFNSDPNKVNRKLVKGILAIAVLLICSMFWVLMYSFFFAPEKKNYASIVSGAKSLDQLYPAGTFSNGEEVAKTGEVQINNAEAKSAEPIMNAFIQPTIDSSPKDFQNIKSKNNFYIIAGVFGLLENAMKFKSELKSQGFSEANIIDSNAALKMVSFCSYISREAALEELNRLRAEKRDAWIYPR